MKKRMLLPALLSSILLLGGLRPVQGEFFPEAEPDDPDYFLTTNYVDADYIYNAYEKKGLWGKTWPGYNMGYINVYDHGFALQGTIPASALMTDTFLTWDHEITIMTSDEAYLYVGTDEGYVIQIDKETLQRTGWCNPCEYNITGIVAGKDGYLYAAAYHGYDPPYKPQSEQIFKIDPNGMKVIAGVWAPDSTHSLASDGIYLYTTTCARADTIKWGEFDGYVDGGMVLVIDPVTMTGLDILSAGMEELQNFFLIVGDAAYFLDTCDYLYRLDLPTREITKITKVPGLYVRRMFESGGRVYLEDEAECGTGTPGYYRMDLATPWLVEHLESGQQFFSVCVFGRKLYLSYGHELEIEDINRPPVLEEAGPFTVCPGGTLLFTLEATDPDGDPPSYCAGDGTLPDGASLDPKSGAFSWKTAPGQASPEPYILLFTADDGWGGTDQVTVEITVGGCSKLKTALEAGGWKPSKKLRPLPDKKLLLKELPRELPANPFPPRPGPDPVPNHFRDRTPMYP
ncbi:MAG: Ig domain-containing protein [PVC group bacterium]